MSGLLTQLSQTRESHLDLPRVLGGEAIVLRVYLQRVSPAMTVEHGASRLLMLAANQQAASWEAIEEEEQLAAHRETLDEIARREEALPGLPEDDQPGALQALSDLNQTARQQAQTIAARKQQRLKRLIEGYTARDPGGGMQQRVAIVAAGVIAVQAYDADDDGNATTPKRTAAGDVSERQAVKLTTVREEEDAARGVYHVSLFTSDELVRLANAIYQHSEGSEAHRAALERFRNGGPPDGGAGVEAEQPVGALAS